MHDEHRKRMKTRYLEHGFDNFAKHEILEMLLYYGKPQGDTNPEAHLLLEHFGSLKGIFEASVDELIQVPGIGIHTAILLKLIPESMRRYAEETSEHIVCYNSLSKIGIYLFRRFIGLDHERLYMMMFNNRMNLIDCILISEGVVNSTNVPIRLMTERALQKKAACVVIAHNHPSGLAVPSNSDLEVTDLINNAFHLLDITLLEHLIIADNRFWPIMKQHCGMFRCSPISGKVESGFYEHFYDVDPEIFTFPPLFDTREMIPGREP